MDTGWGSTVILALMERNSVKTRDEIFSVNKKETKFINTYTNVRTVET